MAHCKHCGREARPLSDYCVRCEAVLGKRAGQPRRRKCSICNRPVEGGEPLCRRCKKQKEERERGLGAGRI